MATFAGRAGVVRIGANAVAEVRNWSVEASGDTIDDSVMGDTWRTFKAGLKSWTGSADVLFDDTDTNGQMACTVGASLTVSFLMEGTGAGSHRLTGTALVTARNISGSHEGLVEASLSFQGSGELTENTL